jgi:hypothetical protein
MKLEFVPILSIAKEFYQVPLGMERFDAYIKAMGAYHDDIALVPMVGMNPMAKPHVSEKINELIALEVEAAIETELSNLEQAFMDFPGFFKVGICVADDVKGGWTNRYLNDCGSRFFEVCAIQKRPWVTVILWASETYTYQKIRAILQAQVFRTIYRLQFGDAKTLLEHLTQEGQALAFAQNTVKLEFDDLEYSREVIAPYLTSTHFPTIFASLYGDEAAKNVGYPALGLSSNAGFELALFDELKTPNSSLVLKRLSL